MFLGTCRLIGLSPQPRQWDETVQMETSGLDQIARQSRLNVQTAAAATRDENLMDDFPLKKKFRTRAATGPRTSACRLEIAVSTEHQGDTATAETSVPLPRTLDQLLP